MTTSNDRTRLTGAFLGNILARVGHGDAPAEESRNEEAAEESQGEGVRDAEADWYPYDDSSSEDGSFEDEEARLEEEELEGDGLEGGEGFALGPWG